MAAVLLCYAVLLLTACGLGPLHRGAGSGGDGGSAEGAIHVDLIRGMLAQEHYYAALAHIQDEQNRQGNTPELRGLEAEARRHLGQTAAAEKLYRGLLHGAYEAEAYHGLGLLYAKTNPAAAIEPLRLAAERAPADALMHNDLGYALMVAGRYAEALPQLATAAELDPDGTRSRNNLIVLLLVTRDEAGAKQVAAQSGVTGEGLEKLRKQAQTLAAKPRAPAPLKQRGTKK